MTTRHFMRHCLAVLIALVAGVLSYALLCLATLRVFAALFEGSGHPPLPDAPDWMYVLALFVVAPLVGMAVTAAVWVAARRALVKPGNRIADGPSAIG